MSAITIQRVAIRMHHDPVFRNRVYADPLATLGDLDLTDGERSLLVLPDRRAWAVDAGRRDRVLEALRVEFPTSCALVELTGGREPLLAFFGSDAFHDSVQRRSDLFEAFGGWLTESGRAGRWGKARLAALATLETAAAHARRAEVPPFSEGELPGRLRRPDHARLVDVPEGGLELFAALVSGLASGSVPAAARLPRLGGGVEHVLIERRPGPGAELSVSAIPGPLASLLEVGAVGVATDHLRAHLRAEGTDGTEDEILAGLVADRLLVEA